MAQNVGWDGDDHRPDSDLAKERPHLRMDSDRSDDADLVRRVDPLHEIADLERCVRHGTPGGGSMDAADTGGGRVSA